MVAKSGGKIITKKEAEDTVKAVLDWVESSDNIREDQKAGKFNQQAEYITNYINNSTPYKGEVYRGLGFESEKEAMDWIQGEGNILDNQHAHASWTSDPEIAEIYSEERSYGTGQKVILKAVNKTGASIHNIANAAMGTNAQEVIVPKNATHRVVRVIKGDPLLDEPIMVEVEEIKR